MNELNDPNYPPVPADQPGILQQIGAPLKRFFVGQRVPLDQKFAEDLGVADAMPDPTQRGHKLVQIKQKMFQAGYGPDDTMPVLKPRSDRVLADLQSTGNANAVIAMERAMGRLRDTAPSTVGEMMRVPGQIESEAALTGERRAGTYKNLVQGEEAETRTRTVLPAQAAAATTAAGRNVAQGDLAKTRAGDITATQPPRINEILARTRQANANAAQGEQGTPRGQLSEADIYKTLATLAGKLTGNAKMDAEVRAQMDELEARKAQLRQPQPTQPVAEPVQGIGMSVPRGTAAPVAQPDEELPDAPDAAAKPLTPELAQQFLQQAGGDKDQARQMARQAGYTF